MIELFYTCCQHVLKSYHRIQLLLRLTHARSGRTGCGDPKLACELPCSLEQDLHLPALDHPCSNLMLLQSEVIDSIAQTSDSK
jgi:hypothetical protein